MFSEETATILKNGGVCVIPTDTLYGIVGSALCPETVERIYSLRKRDTDKPLIVLIAGAIDLIQFGIQLTAQETALLNDVWPGKVSVVLRVNKSKYAYLHRGKKSIAFRCPGNEDLRELIINTGPLVAPSVNPQNMPPATTIQEAKDYFGENIEAYVDGGILNNSPSKLIQIVNGQVVILRDETFVKRKGA
jgi:L-threonylcarbamoyladenylate synthase